MWFEKLITGGVDKVIDSATKGLDRLFTSDEERLKAEVLLNQIKAELTTTLITSFTKVIKMQSDIIISEMKGESWLQRNWRPATMMVFTFIIANEYLLAPYIQLLFNNLVPFSDKKRTVLYLIWKDPYMSINQNTFINDMIMRSGFQNVIEDNNVYPMISEEQIKELDPDFIFLSSEPYPFKEKHLLDFQQQFGIIVYCLLFQFA